MIINHINDWYIENVEEDRRRWWSTEVEGY